MGNYRIIIEGVGPHGNTTRPTYDADIAAQDLVDHLGRSGHTISSATFEVATSITPTEIAYGKKTALRTQPRKALDAILDAIHPPSGNV